MPKPPLSSRCHLVLAVLAVLLAGSVPAHAQPAADFVPVTDAMLQDPAPGDWLMWRRTLDGWGYSPLDQMTRENVADLRLVWSRALTAGASQQGTPLVYDGVMYMPNPRDVIQAIDAATGDLRWEHRRPVPEDIAEYVGGLEDTNRNLAIYGSRIIDTSADDHIFALDAATGQLAWDTEILDYKTAPARQSSGPIVANGKVISGRSCRPRAGPYSCIITAHDSHTGAELWRTSTIPRPGEPGDESWGGVPFEERWHVGAWMVPSYDPALNLIYMGTSVTSPAPKFMLGGADNKHLYHNSTLALDGDTGEIAWYYQHRNATIVGSVGSRRRRQCASVRSAEASTRASRRSSFAPDGEMRSRKRSSCFGLIEWTSKPRSIRLSTTGPRGTSIATPTAATSLSVTVTHLPGRVAPLRLSLSYMGRDQCLRRRRSPTLSPLLRPAIGHRRRSRSRSGLRRLPG